MAFNGIRSLCSLNGILWHSMAVFFSFAIFCHSAIFDCACHSGLKARMPLNAILLAPLSSLVSRLSSNEKRPLHTRVVAFLFAHAPQHLLLRLLSTLLHERASMYALQKHSAKILFFYYIKKPSKQIFQQLIKISLQDIFPIQKAQKRPSNITFYPENLEKSRGGVNLQVKHIKNNKL